MNKEIKLLVADDHALFRSGIIELLSDEPSVKIVGEASDGEELINKCLELQPDIALTDISMPKYSGLRALQEIKKFLPDIKILFLSMHDDDAHVYHAYSIGAKGLLGKNISKQNLLAAIHTISRGGMKFLNMEERELFDYIKKHESKNFGMLINIDTLTTMELAVLSLISDGMSSREIAVNCNVSKRTIDTHRTHICHKLNITSNCRLISFAVENKKRIKESLCGEVKLIPIPETTKIQ